MVLEEVVLPEPTPATKQAMALQLGKEIAQAIASDELDLWLGENNPSKPEGTEYQESLKALRSGIDKYNEALRAVAEEAGVELESMPKPTPETHVTVAGTRLQQISNELYSLRLTTKAMVALGRPTESAEQRAKQLVESAELIQKRITQF